MLSSWRLCLQAQFAGNISRLDDSRMEGITAEKSWLENGRKRIQLAEI